MAIGLDPVVGIKNLMAVNSMAAKSETDPIKQALYHAQNVTLGNSIGSTYDPGSGTWTHSDNAAQTLAANQKSAQDYINNPSSGQGGVDNYQQTQMSKLLEAKASGNSDMINRLNIDSQRTGLNYSAPPITTGGNAGGTGTVVSNGDNNTPTGTGATAPGNTTAQDYINKLDEARKQASYAALGKSRDAALSNLQSEQSAIQPKYYDQRNQVSAGAQQQARNFAEYMANRGGTSSGANAQATLMNNMATQGNLGALGRQEAAAYTDIGRRTSDVQNAYQSDVSSADAGAESDKLKALLQDYYTNQQRSDTQGQQAIQNKLAEAQLTGTLNGAPTMAAQGQTFNQGIAQAGVTGNYLGQRTLAGQNTDLNSTQTMAQLTGYISDGNGGYVPTNAKQQQDLTNAWTQAEQTGTVTPDLSQLTGIPAGTQTQTAKNQAIQNGISQQNANTSAYSAQTGRLGQENASNIANANAFGTTNENGQQSIDYQNKNLDNLYKTWTDSGVAPAGIPGVQKGTSLYDRTAAQKAVADAYKTWNETGVAPEGIPGIAAGTPKYNAVDARVQGMNSNESAITKSLDAQIAKDPTTNVKKALESEKSVIVGQVGAAGYQRIYNLYFDSFGNPK